MKFMIINGPNLNLLGIREPEIYGRESYEDLLSLIREWAERRGAEVEFFQSNHEGALVDAIQQAYFEKLDGIVINPGAYTHTSVAIADAVKAVSLPVVEVHISRVDEREPFRRISYIRDVAAKTISGEGVAGYLRALDFLADGREGRA